ncbi:MAG: hypothetical protein ACREFD_17370 [Stellaceae bacterium]
MTLALTILGLLAKYLPLAITAINAGVVTFESVHTTMTNMQAAMLHPTDDDRVAAETEIGKLEALLNGGVPSA